MKIFEEKPLSDCLRVAGDQSTNIAIGSFAIGSLLFGLYKAGFQSEQMLILGFVFVIAAVVVNLFVLANLLILFCIKRHYREYFAVKMCIVLANVPITIAYLNYM
jgi:hypothetical protein